ncbi:MAG: glycosyltransferase [Ottowia sp.]|uniref:glycosyltransferase n=1 Tax=Ottowia sp. TaxID=1898956 RepID=UPI003C78BBAE
MSRLQCLLALSATVPSDHSVASNAVLLIVNFNTASLTLRCIESVQRGSMQPQRILVLDNGSCADDLAHLLSRLQAMPSTATELQLYRSEQNLGFAAGCNLLVDLALEDARCAHILLLNSDAVAMPNMVSAMQACAMQTAAATGMVGARMHKLASPDEVDTLGISLYRSLMPADRHTVADKLLGPSGGCCLLKRGMLEDLHRVSGYYFDARYFCYCEDTDLALRAVLSGYQTAFLDEVLALHEGQASSGGNVNAFVTYHGLRNSIWMHAKLLPAGVLLQFGAWLLLAHMLSIARHGLFGRWGLLWRVYRDAFARLPEFWRERKRFHPQGSALDDRLLAHISPGFYRARYLSHVLRVERRRRFQNAP